MIIHCPSHTEAIFRTTDFPAVVDWAVSQARQAKIDAIAGCGHSGLLVAGAMGYILNIPVIAVRKGSNEAKADGFKVNAVLSQPATRWAIIDDLVASGDTVKRIVETSREAGLVHGNPKLLLLYRGTWNDECTKNSIGFKPTIKVMGRDS